MRHLKGVLYGGLFAGVVSLAAFILAKQADSMWKEGEIGEEKALAFIRFSNLFLDYWYIVLIGSVGCAVLFFHLFKKEKEEDSK